MRHTEALGVASTQMMKIGNGRPPRPVSQVYGGSENVKGRIRRGAWMERFAQAIWLSDKTNRRPTASEMARNHSGTLTKPSSIPVENQIHIRDYMKFWGDE